MLINDSIHHIMNGALKSVEEIIPTSISYDEPKVFNHKEAIFSMGVQIKLTGDIQAELYIQGDTNTFQNLAAILFGMELEGDMLQSFTGEFGNLIGGHLSMQISKLGIHTDITPPNVLSEERYLIQHKETAITSVYIQEHGNLDVMVCLHK